MNTERVYGAGVALNVFVCVCAGGGGYIGGWYYCVGGVGRNHVCYTGIGGGGCAGGRYYCVGGVGRSYD